MFVVLVGLAMVTSSAFSLTMGLPVLAADDDSGGGGSGGSDSGDSGGAGGSNDNSKGSGDGGNGGDNGGSNKDDNSGSGSEKQEQQPHPVTNPGEGNTNTETEPQPGPGTTLPAPIPGLVSVKPEPVEKKPLPYCDTPEGKAAKACHDRYDFDDKTGLYPFNYGTQKKNPKDCKDASKPGPPSHCDTLGCLGNPPDPNKGCFGGQKPGKDGLCAPHNPGPPIICPTGLAKDSHGKCLHPGLGPGPCLHKEKSGRCFPWPPNHPCWPGFKFKHGECIKKIVIDIHTHNNGGGSSGSQSLSDDCYDATKIAWLGKVQRGDNKEVDDFIDNCMDIE